MGKKKQKDLGARERQIMDVIFELGEGSVTDVLRKLADPPSYSAVRTMIRLLESKGFLKHRQEGTKYVYRPTQSPTVARKSALKHVMQTFFGGSAPDAVAAIFDSEKLSPEDLKRIERLIDDARKEGQ
ncbi:BlaI/MecI/CopY family transcriptional regulator [Fuerstiella marisgermanici]|uniref:Regulatory protein BlaI n=1 Tax=Fuerstiella marisgermanici TaxID=1891926 RepID=A0A1P8WP91_9PLAN|nr:BlaI/MecI/CopY family transcriptional regulator [Fuerstiella marisgermanici]APZ95866.1 Regulatory protein BlaI [Fuerstiella marisgermanici]